VIGLHSFHHPTRFANLSSAEQMSEYGRNCDHLRYVLGKSPVAMSHPCNSYSTDTLNILGRLGIEIGFRAYPDELDNRSRFEFPREDHALVMKRMRT